VLNNSQDIVLTLGRFASLVNIVAQGVMMKEKPNANPHESKFYVLIAESSFIDLCDFLMKTNIPFLMLLSLSS